MLAYHGGPTLSELVWIDRTGRQIGTLGATGSYNDVRISRNGREVAVVMVDRADRIVEYFDLRPGLGHSDEVHLRVAAAPAGRSGRPATISSSTAWLAPTVRPTSIRNAPMDGAGRRFAWPWTVSSSRWMRQRTAATSVYNDTNRATIRDIWLLPLVPPGPPRPFLATTAVEQDARLSPDSRWVAFVSSESGKAEV